MNHQWYPIWAMALMTGMRSGELYALEWSDVDFESKRITVSKSWNGRLKKIKSTKGNYWREVPINEELGELLKSVNNLNTNSNFVLPRNRDWDRGESAKVLRAFCFGIGVPSVKFHALRACFATQMLKQGIAPAVVMKIGGWKELKTMQIYLRLAGIEIDDATRDLSFLPMQEVTEKIINLHHYREK